MNAVLWKEGRTYELPDAMEKSPKNFQLIGGEAEGPVCPECGRECKSEFGLRAHMRKHR